MPRKKKKEEDNGVKGNPLQDNAHILGAGEVENQGTAKAKDNTLVLTVAIMGGAMLVIIAILVGVNIHLANARKRLNRRLEDKK